eukprot:3077566-Rhodomonas_salina.2
MECMGEEKRQERLEIDRDRNSDRETETHVMRCFVCRCYCRVQRQLTCVVSVAHREGEYVDFSELESEVLDASRVALECLPGTEAETETT